MEYILDIPVKFTTSGGERRVAEFLRACRFETGSFRFDLGKCKVFSPAYLNWEQVRSKWIFKTHFNLDNHFWKRSKPSRVFIPLFCFLFYFSTNLTCQTNSKLDLPFCNVPLPTATLNLCARIKSIRIIVDFEILIYNLFVY